MELQAGFRHLAGAPGHVGRGARRTGQLIEWTCQLGCHFSYDTSQLGGHA
jgi:hypothetical protein